LPIYKVCNAPGCRAIYIPQAKVHRCPEHQADYEQARNARRKQTYNSAAFRRARAYLLETVGQCQAEGPHSGTLDVHHRNGNARDNRPSNLILLCRAHHSETDTQRRQGQKL
jgi:hypothetical protein